MKFEIKNRFDGSLLFSLETSTIKLCLEAAVKCKADLSGADLAGMNLFAANLCKAKLSGANFFEAGLSKVNLFKADISWANFCKANLYKANLCKANIFGADFSEADLFKADISWANLAGTNFCKANLFGANFSRTDLAGADLSKTNLSETNFFKADLFEANVSQTGFDPQNNPNGDCKEFKSIDNDWVIGYRTRETSAAWKILVDDRIYSCEVFSTLDTECHPGWYLWPKLEDAENFSGKEKEYIRVKSRKSDIHKAGNKWRSRTIWVLGGTKGR